MVGIGLSVREREFAYGGMLEAVAIAVHLQDAEVRRSSRAPVSRSNPRISVHSWNVKFDVIRVDPLS